MQRASYGGYTQMENNFSMYWGLAIMMYESTLISDEAPIDKFIGWAGTPANPNALTAQQKRGLALFRGPKTSCVACHKGAEYTSAGTRLQPALGETNLTEQMFLGTRTTGPVRQRFLQHRRAPDRGRCRGGRDRSLWRSAFICTQYIAALSGKPAPDAFLVNPCLFAIKTDVNDCHAAPSADLARVGVDGAFKVPSLRNVALTQPYFHNGSRFTLEQVVEFYDRGGDRRGPDGNDTSGLSGPSAPNGSSSNVHPASPSARADGAGNSPTWWPFFAAHSRTAAWPASRRRSTIPHCAIQWSRRRFEDYLDQQE